MSEGIDRRVLDKCNVKFVAGDFIGVRIPGTGLCYALQE